MVIFSQVRATGLVRRGLSFAPAVVVLWFVGGCVNLTAPWDKADAGRASRAAGAAGAGARPSTGGSSGAGGITGSRDSNNSGSREPGREPDASGGGTLQPGSSSARSSGRDVDSDGPSSGSGGAGGQPDAGVDAPLSSARSTSSMVGDGDANAPDGKGGVGGSASQGGASGTGSGGALPGGASGTGRGGSSSQGGTSGTGSGGTSKAGSATGGRGGSSSSSSFLPDAGFDANPLLTGLAVYYPFESATGTVLPDLSGHGRDGTLSIGLPPDGGETPTGSGYEFVNGKVGKGLALHKAGLGYVRVPPEVFADASELTIALWVNITTEQWWQRILDVGITPIPYQYCNSDTGTQYFNILPKAGSDRLFSISTDGHSHEQALTASSLPTNTWTHIAVVLPSGGGARLYLNGRETATNDALTLRPADLGTIDYAFIGKSRFDADPPFEGIVDAFRVYRRALSAAEVLALYNDPGP